MDQERQKRLDEIAAVAVRVSAETKVPALTIVAQWAVESQWGAAPAGKCNYFGIKRAVRHKAFCVVTTHEYFTPAQIATWNRAHPERPARVVSPGTLKSKVELDDEFADYASLADSCADYAWMISHAYPYAGAWLRFLADGSVDELVTGVARRYSTSAEYADLVTAISKQANVTGAIDTARSGA